MKLPRSEGTQRTGIGESLPGAPPAIGASAPADPPREPMAGIGRPGRVPQKYQAQFEASAGLIAGGPHRLRWESDLATSAVSMVCGCGARINEDILQRCSNEYVLFLEMLMRMADAHLKPDPSGVLALAAREGFTAEGQ